jgi:hypothetical protein
MAPIIHSGLLTFLDYACCLIFKKAMLPTAGESVWGKLLTSDRQEELFSLSRHFFQTILDCYIGLVWLNYFQSLHRYPYKYLLGVLYKLIKWCLSCRTHLSVHSSVRDLVLANSMFLGFSWNSEVLYKKLLPKISFVSIKSVPVTL